jgi:nitrite reductase/ring-hydroxylating ferredoxin subunit
MTKKTNRREFIKLGCSALAVVGAADLLAACDSAGTSTGTGTGITVSGNTVTIDLTQATQLTKSAGIVNISSLKMVVINAKEGYKAFSSVCLHEGETVNEFDGTSMRCPSHGWKYSSAGAVTAGGSGTLKSYTVVTNGTTLTITKA